MKNLRTTKEKLNNTDVELTNHKIINVKPKQLTIFKYKSISKTLKIFFIVLQMIFSYDFGFITYKSKSQRLIIIIGSGILQFTLEIFWAVLLWTQSIGWYGVTWFTMNLFQIYASIVILLMIPEKNNFRKFLEHLLWMDSEINANCASCSVDFKIMLVFLLSFLSKMLLSAIFCSNSDSCLNAYSRVVLMTTLLTTSADIPITIYFFVFYAARLRLVALTKFVSEETFNVKDAHILYKSLIDRVENLKWSFNIIVSIIKNQRLIIYKLILKHLRN